MNIFSPLSFQNTNKLLGKVECHFQYFECHKDPNHDKSIKICDRIFFKIQKIIN